MFKSTNDLFGNIECPSIKLNLKCGLINCIFSHKRTLKSNRIEVEDVRKKIRSEVESDKVGEVTKDIDHDPVISLTKPVSTTPAISTTPTIVTKTITISSNTAKSTPTPRKDAQNLTARPMTSSPATLPQRMSYLQTIHKTIVTVGGHPLPKKLAIHLEYKTASTSSTVSYPINIRSVIKNIKAGNYRPENIIKNRQTTEKNNKEIFQNQLEKLIIPVEILKTRKYEIELPSISANEFDPNSRVNCDRCGITFDVNNKESTICTFHLLRRLYDPVKGKRSDIFPCCSQPLGESNGCCTNDRHVFKLEEGEVLASIIPYTKVPRPPASVDGTSSRLFAAAIDCEMAYTSFGMELIRLTVVDWDTGKTVLDRTIYPYGEIIDLNTRFSGVHSLEDGITINGVKYDTITFRNARELFFDLIDSSTILIGHGLENDLRALRICHSRIVDTAIRYPTLKPTRTHSLKELTFKYLGRTIQIGEHDSSEDAIAAMDIVKENIRRETGIER